MNTTYKEFTYKEKSKKILNIIGDFIENNGLEGSFTNHFKEKDSDKEIDKLLKILRDNNCDFQIFYQDFKDEILKDHYFTGDGYFLDLLLYKFEDRYPIGGLSLDENELDEHVIKYKYGYYKYDLGKKYILQTYSTLEDYFYQTATCFISSMLVGNEMRNKLQMGLNNVSNSAALNITEKSSVVQKENGYTALIIDMKIFMSILQPFIEKNVNILDFLFDDLKLSNIYNYFESNEKYLILFFGKNHGTIKLPEEELEDLEIKYSASKYNI